VTICDKNRYKYIEIDKTTYKLEVLCQSQLQKKTQVSTGRERWLIIVSRVQIPPSPPDKSRIRGLKGLKG